MKYINSFKFFESEDTFKEGEDVETIKDILSDINDSGFETKVTDTNNEIIVNISKPGIEHKRHTNLGFRISEILPTLKELHSQLKHEFNLDVAYFHIKGYEPSTWYSADTIDDLTKIGETHGEDILDQLELQFEIC